MGKDPSVQLIEKTITENGTYDAITDGANGYSKVNVNVQGGGGSSDFSTAEVTLVGNAIYMALPLVIYDDPESPMGHFLYCRGDAQLLEPNTYTVALYKGYLLTRLESDGPVSVSLSGGCEWLSEEIKTLLITGDCTITIS